MLAPLYRGRARTSSGVAPRVLRGRMRLGAVLGRAHRGALRACTRRLRRRRPARHVAVAHLAHVRSRRTHVAGACSISVGATTCASPATTRTTTRRSPVRSTPCARPRTRRGRRAPTPRRQRPRRSTATRLRRRLAPFECWCGPSARIGATATRSPRFGEVVPAFDGERRGERDRADEHDEQQAHEMAAFEHRLRHLADREHLDREQRAQHEHRGAPTAELRCAEQRERGREVPGPHDRAEQHDDEQADAVAAHGSDALDDAEQPEADVRRPRRVRRTEGPRSTIWSFDGSPTRGTCRSARSPAASAATACPSWCRCSASRGSSRTGRCRRPRSRRR